MALTSQTLKTYFESDLGVDTSDMDDSTALFSSGIIDSFALVSLITFLEQECSLRMNPLDVNLDNLDSIERILEFVDRVVQQA
jgi:acyl carrier protein